MDHAVVLQYINALGFPICVSGALGWALYKIGFRLLDSHFDLVLTLKQQGQDTIKELKTQSSLMATQSDLLSKWPSDPMSKLGCKLESSSGLEHLAKTVAAHVKVPKQA